MMIIFKSIFIIDIYVTDENLTAVYGKFLEIPFLFMSFGGSGKLIIFYLKFKFIPLSIDSYRVLIPSAVFRVHDSIHAFTVQFNRSRFNSR
jgi:hypothetical protein